MGISRATSATVMRSPVIVATKGTVAEKLAEITKLRKSVKKGLRSAEKTFPSPNLTRKRPRNTKKGSEKVPGTTKRPWDSTKIKKKSSINIRNQGKYLKK